MRKRFRHLNVSSVQRVNCMKIIKRLLSLSMAAGYRTIGYENTVTSWINSSSTAIVAHTDAVNDTVLLCLVMFTIKSRN